MNVTAKPRAVRKPHGGRSLRLQGILVFCLLAGFASFNVAFGLILNVWFGLSLLLMVLLIGLLGSRTYRRLRQVMRQRGRFVRRLRFAEARKRSILDSAGDGIITVDEHGVVRSFNRAATRIFGYAPGEALGHGFSLFLPQAGAGNAEPMVGTGEAIILGTSAELCGRRKDGSRFPVEPAVSKIRVGGRRYFTYVVRDLTERKQAEDSLRRARDELEARVQERTAQLADTVVVLRDEVAERRRAESALRASEEKFAKAFHGSPDAILITTVTEGRLVEVNHSFQTLTGYGREEVLGRTTPELKVWVRPEDRERYLQVLAERGSVRDLEFPFRLKSGEVRLGQVSADHIQVGGTPCLIATIRDVTERKKHEETLRDYAARLRTLSRQLMEAQELERRRLARELHDEIGQNLTAISINLQVARRTADPEVQPRLDEGLAITQRTIEQVRSLSLDLRPSMLDDLGLVAALRWYVARQAERAGFAAHLDADSVDERLPPELETTCFRLVQEALTNVVRHAQAANVEVLLRRRPDALDLTVRDDGAGFDPRAARKGTLRGAGLGLLGMQERVQLAGGRLEVTSAPGQGTSIHARFPLAQAAAPVSSAESKP